MMRAGLRKRFFAWMLRKSDVYSDRLYGNYKRNLLNDIHGTVVEIGPGTGVNFKYLPEGIEPNDAFNEILQQRSNGKRIRAKNF